MERLRGHGEGSIYDRKPYTDKQGRERPGLFVISVSQGTDASGKRIRKRLYAATETEARRKLREALRKHHRGELVPGRRQTIRQFLEDWLENVARHKVRPSTWRRYVQLVRGHLIPSLGHLTLEGLMPEQVQAMLNKKEKEGLAPRTRHHLRAVLRNALNKAIRWKRITSNAAELADPPRIGRPDPQVLDVEQAQRFLEAVESNRLAALYLLALCLGMRQGELLGLRWDDVNFEAAELTVRTALQRIEGGPKLVEPKSATSRRPIPLPEPVLAILREHHERQAAEHVASGPPWQGLVFTSNRGTPLSARNVVRTFKRMLQLAGLPTAIRFYDLRHSCASFLVAQGVDPRTVSDILGHSQVRLTLDTYVHATRTRHREALANLGRLLQLPPKLATPLATPPGACSRPEGC